MTTQENMRAPGYRERQTQIVIDGKKVWADPKLVPLLKALNAAGLKTRSHCEGHETNRSWVVIRMNNIIDIQIRKDDNYNEMVLTWEHPR